ncbi:MAG: DUF4251 domain-containing protein [Alistipes indistinctus]
MQLAFNSGVPGLNGAGGVTLSGTISDLKIRTDKHEVTSLTSAYQLQGNSISSTVIITLFNGDNKGIGRAEPGLQQFAAYLLRKAVSRFAVSDVYKAQPNIFEFPGDWLTTSGPEHAARRCAPGCGDKKGDVTARACSIHRLFCIYLYIPASAVAPRWMRIP